MGYITSHSVINKPSNSVVNTLASLITEASLLNALQCVVERRLTLASCD